MSQTISIANEVEMFSLGIVISRSLVCPDIVLFRGNLGAGKTTLIRAILEGLGCKETVKSPTYNLFSLYDVSVPVLHADLYRLQDARNTGIEDYLDSHLCLVEWPDALGSIVDISTAKLISIEIEGDGRLVSLSNIKV